MTQFADQAFPHLTRWVTTYGWVEIGQDVYSRSFVRALTEGGMIWEGEETYTNLTDALQKLDAAVGAWMKENGFDEETAQQ